MAELIRAGPGRPARGVDARPWPAALQRVLLVVAAVVLGACAGRGQVSPTRGTVGAGHATATTVATAAVSPTAIPASETPTAPQASATAVPEASATAAPQGTGPIDPGAYAFDEVATGFTLPLLVTHAGDGSGRLFVVQEDGAIRIVEDGQVLPEPFLDLTGQVSRGPEQGLLGLAFSPNYAENRMLFINYTDLNGDTHVERCFAAADDPNRAGDCSTLLTQAQPFVNHNGGHLAFGPDGYLYVSLGDGGTEGTLKGTAQNLDTWLGTILRLEVDGDEAPYTTPRDNPFVGRDDARPEIWAYGLRNPWRFSFDHATADLWIGDVGHGLWEEINFQPGDSVGGENYGWDYLEGSHAFEGGPPAGLSLVMPVAEYSHAEGGCAVIAGYTYRGPSLPELVGAFFYGDFCSGLIWTLLPAGEAWQSTLFMASPYGISSFGEDETGELYLTDWGGGSLYRLVRAP